MSEHETDALQLLEQVATEKGEDFELTRRISRPARQLARNLLRFRTAQGLTQSGLASHAQMDQPRIAELESGAGNPTLRTIGKLAEALGVSASRLLSTPGTTSRQQTTPVPNASDQVRQVERAVGVSGMIYKIHLTSQLGVDPDASGGFPYTGISAQETPVEQRPLREVEQELGLAS